MTEGANAVFTMTANPAPPAALTVILNVTATGNYGVTTGLDLATIPANQQTVTHTVATISDSAGEAHGTVTVTVTVGNGYTIGDPDDATVTILDDDNLIEVSNLAQLNAMRWDVDGDGAASTGNEAAYAAAFPTAAPCAAISTCNGYTLTADLDFDTNGSGTANAGDDYWNAGAGWVPIVNYNTEFSGNGHIISNLFINRPSWERVGLFHALTGSSYVHHVGLLDANVTAGPRTGALVGEVTVNARVAAVYATGAVAGNGQYAGGLVGILFGRIDAAWVNVSVTRTDTDGTHGGLVGLIRGSDQYVPRPNEGSLRAAYSLGPVTSSSDSTGNVGGVYGVLFTSGTAADVYFDATTSGETRGGTSKTTAQLRAPTGYTGIYANWDLDLDGDGTNDSPWDFGTAGQYPALKADRDGDGVFTWEEFGDQGRGAPVVTITAVSPSVLEGANAVFTVTANPAPSTAITVNLTITQTGGYVASGSLGAKTVTFAANAATAAYTVPTVDDMIVAANGAVTATLATGTGYTLSNTQRAASVTVVNDTRGVIVDPAAVTVAENAGTGAYTVVLTGRPTGNVTVTPSSGNTAIARVSGARTFTPSNWNVAKTVTVTGVDDSIVNPGGRSASITHSVSGGGYDGVTADDVAVTVTDNDTRGVTITPTALSVSEGAGGTYTVRLNSQPKGSVTVTPSTSDAAVATVSGALTFAAGNWNMPQTVTVTGVDDNVDNPGSARATTITHAVTGGDYGANNVSAAPVTVTVREGGYFEPPEALREGLSYNQWFKLTLPGYEPVTGATTRSEMRAIREDMWSRLELPSNIQTLYPGIDAHNSVLCWEEVGTAYTWVKDGVQITRPSDFQERDDYTGAYGPISGFLFQFPGAPAVRQDTPLTFRLTVRNQDSWLEDRECNGGVMVHELTVTVKGTTVGFAERVGTMPPVLLQAGSSRYFDVKSYFGPAPNALRYEVAVAPAGVANVRLRGSDPTRGLSPTDLILEGLADGEAVVTVKASAAQRYGGATAVQAFRVIVGEQAAIPIRYAPDRGQTEMDVDLNDFVLEGVFDYTYKEWSHGRYRPYEWSWEQLSGPTVRLYQDEHVALFGLPDFPQGTLLKFRVTATQNRQTLVRTGQDASSPATRSYDLLLRVGNPGNIRPLGRPTANAGRDRSASAGAFLSLDGTNSVSPTGSWTDLDFRWEVESAPNRVLTELRTSIADSYEEGAYNGPYIAYFDMPQLYAGESLVFKLTASIWGQTSTDTVRITSSNPLPVANAGPDREQAPGERVVLQGSGSLDPRVQRAQVEYAWVQMSEPAVALSGETTANPWFVLPENAPAGRALRFELTVTDSEGWSQSDTVTITVRDFTPPTANAGPDLTGAPGESVALQGKGSTNPYGRWHEMAYQWTQLSGPAVTLTHPRTTQPASKFADPSFTVPADAAGGTTLEFELTVTDQWGQSDSDTMIVTVAAPEVVRPTATAGPDLTGAPGEIVTLQGKGSVNPYGRWHEMAHQWTQLSGPTVTLTHPKTSQPANKFADPSFTIPADAAGGTTLEFQLTVTDKEGQSDSDTMIVTVTGAEPENTPPTASIDAAQVAAAAAGETVQLQGVGNDAETAAGSLTFAWSQAGGTPTVSIANSSTATASFTAPGVTAETSLTFRLTVTDEDGLSATAETTITISPPPEPENTPPTASIDAGQVTSAEAGETVQLQGVGSDAETAAGSLTFAWSQAGGTPSVSIANASTATASFTAPDVTEETDLTFRLTVTDQGGLSTTAETTIAISSPPEPENTPPAFDEGASATRSLAENSPAGTNVGDPIAAKDPDEDTLTYSLSGADAGAFSIDPGTGQVTTRSGVVYDYEAKPTYFVTVNAADGKGLSASIPVTVNLTDVEEAPPNRAPVFNEGNGATRSLPENSEAGENVGAPLTATDQDDDTLTYSLSGADDGSFDINANTGQLLTRESVTYDYESKSTYAVTVTAEDPEGASASIAVTVSLTDVEEAAPNRDPVFDEGDSATRTLAENTAGGENVGLPLTATDQDEDTLTYSLTGADAESFDIEGATGQLTTREGAAYDYESRSTYAVTVTAEDPEGAIASIAVTVNLTDVDETPPEPEPTSITSCFTNLGSLSGAAEFSGAWDDADCRAHHQDSLARYVHFTLTEETKVEISLESGGTLFVSKDTPKNGWGTPPNSDYETRRMVRRGNGKLVHDGAHTGSNRVTLTLAAGDYTAEAAGFGGGTFTLSVTPTEE